ncbi:MHYT domain-containing protein [Rhizobium calliandrae]|uniref:MHYT domain-containing protein n=1 Tax=Rhizobium calliandrae TaxID=1312182 RepID=A0ABT7KPJ8_9HYPH|nr:MHYT domain-containing protein [Rhizobium calliandrae]MDL2409193.1 MHYT domain-containing protein [Rhizobium calliandrae]
MFAEHDPFLVALSVAVAIMGGYTGFGLAARIRSSPGANRRLLLAGAAAFLAIGIWTMHFIGMLAAPIPSDAVYLVLPTVVSFLICALVVGISLFFVSIGEQSSLRILASAVLLGLGIASMHYVGIHGLAGHFSIEHDRGMVLLSVLIGVVAAYGGLRIFLAGHGGFRLAFSAVAFGIAVSGMHYTAMYGMHFSAAGAMDQTMAMDGLAASPQVLALIVALLCFLVAVGFLLFLVPEARPRPNVIISDRVADLQDGGTGAGRHSAAVATRARTRAAPLAGLGQPPSRPMATRVPIEAANGTQFIEVSEIRSIRADAHYTLVHDGQRERMCSWPISEAESLLCPDIFMRVHRSHIVAVPHITFMRREGDGAVVELDGPAPHLVPVSRAKIAELKARLGLAKGEAAKATR